MLSFWISCLICGCDGKKEQAVIDPREIEQNKLLQYFVAANPGKTVILYAQEDLNNDGQKDLLVLYRISREKNMMRVILDMGKTCTETNEVPAPVSHQTVRFKDIDEKPPMEFIVQGMKGAKIGYAIFRIENGQLIDIFGQGMEDCC